MKITVLGAGYVGLVSAACLAQLGHEVVVYDPDENKINLLLNGVMPIHEAGLKEVVKKNVDDSRLFFVNVAYQNAIRMADIIFIAVGTPQGKDGRCDLTHVMDAADMIGKSMAGHYYTVVIKSTVPVGTSDKVRDRIAAKLSERPLTDNGRASTFAMVSNPEFLKEGSAVADFLRPDRIVIGADHHVAIQHMRELYTPFNRNHERTLYMSIRAAEFTKYVSNAMLATRISFMNEMANLADKVGVDIEEVRRGVGADPRIGYDFLYPGCGYGGSCFPKDVDALLDMGIDANEPMHVLRAVAKTNSAQKFVLFKQILERFPVDLGDDEYVPSLSNALEGKRFAVWGLSFKPNTDDLRESPSMTLIKQLVKSGAIVQVHDPIVTREKFFAALVAMFLETSPDRTAAEHLATRVHFTHHPLDALDDVDALCIVTEWKDYLNPNIPMVFNLMKTPIIFDGRNIYDPVKMKADGFEYHTIGRNTHLSN